MSALRFGVIVACAGLLASPMAAARCIGGGCFAVTFDTRACTYETNKAKKFSGVKLTVRAAAISAVPCHPDQTVTWDDEVLQIVGITEYRYLSDDPDACKAFEGQRVTKLMAGPKCCDVIPSATWWWCNVKEDVLTDLPPWAVGKRKGWEAPPGK